jgi:acyl-CoA synthetase (AMP-forming)/AMP-acid ligase II
MLDLTLGRSLRLAAERDPGAVALRFEGATLTHGELNAWGNRIARALLETGMQKGDRLGVLLPNSPLYVAVAYAAAKAGIPLVLLNYRFTGAEIAYHLGDASASAIVSDPRFEPAVDAMRVHLPALRLISTPELEKLAASQSSDEPDCEVRENDVLVLQYTSGTTGRPKGAIITHRNRSLAFLHWPIIYGYGSGDTCLHTGPFHHSAPFGMTLSQLCLGGRAVIMPSFKADQALRLIAQEAVTWCFMVPYMYNAIYALLRDKATTFDSSKLRVLLSGASPLPTVVKERILEAFPNAGLFEFYGATEAGTITVLRPEDQRRKIRCVGKPVLGSEVKLVDPEGRPVANGEVGEIFLKTPSIFEGYFNAPDKTDAAFRDGWCTLGDLGRLDDEGYLYIVDRLKDVIKSGGVNIYPSEVEEVVLAHPDVLEAAVIGVPDERWGEAVRAIVVPRSGRPLDPAELVAHCRARLADYKVPKSVEVRAELPHSPAGKILKRVLREIAWSTCAVKI